MTTTTDQHPLDEDGPAATGDAVGRQGLSWRGFRVLAGGQIASMFGTGVSSIGVSIVAFLETGSVWWLAVLYLATRIPAVLIAGHAGALADRLDRRMLLLGADAAAGLATVGALALHVTGGLELWHLVVLAIVGSIANAYQEPAFIAAVPTLVGPDRLDKANGIIQLGPALATLAAPAAGGALVAWQGIGGVLVVDLVTFLLAVGATAWVRFPSPSATGESDTTDLRGLRASWAYLTGSRRALRRLVVASSAANLLLAMVNVLLLALVLPLVGEEGAGLLLSLGGVAMLVASIGVSVRGLPARRVWTVAWGLTVVGGGLVLMALRPSALTLAGGLVVTLGAASVASAASATVFHATVEPEWQGRIAALRRVAAEALVPVTVLAVAPLVESLAEPAMAPGGALADTVGAVLGVGPGRGVALVFVVVGLVVAVVGRFLAADPVASALDDRMQADAAGAVAHDTPGAGSSVTHVPTAAMPGAAERDLVDEVTPAATRLVAGGHVATASATAGEVPGSAAAAG